MADTIDFYSEANQNDSYTALCSDSANCEQAVAQSFVTPSSPSYTLDSAKFYLKKGGSPTGNATYIVYAQTGTPGTNAKPTGSALATSDNLDVSGLTTGYALYAENYSGANRISLSNSTNYEVAVAYSGGNAANFVQMGSANPGTDAGANPSELNAGTWAGNNTQDVCFYVYGVSAVTGGIHLINLIGVGN